MRKQNFEPLTMNLQLFAEEPDNNPTGDDPGTEPDQVPDDDIGGDRGAGGETEGLWKNQKLIGAIALGIQ